MQLPSVYSSQDAHSGHGHSGRALRAFEYRPGVGEVPGDVSFMGEQAKTSTQRPKSMALLCVGRKKRIGLREQDKGRARAFPRRR